MKIEIRKSGDSMEYDVATLEELMSFVVVAGGEVLLVVERQGEHEKYVLKVVGGTD